MIIIVYLPVAIDDGPNFGALIQINAIFLFITMNAIQGGLTFKFVVETPVCEQYFHMVLCLQSQVMRINRVVVIFMSVDENQILVHDHQHNSSLGNGAVFIKGSYNL